MFLLSRCRRQLANIVWKEVGERAAAIAGGLRSLGINVEDRCAILSNTRVEWIFCDLGILCAGAATTTIYPSSGAEEAAYIINDSGTKIVFVEDDSQVEKLNTVKDQLGGVEKIINITGKNTDGDKILLTFRS